MTLDHTEEQRALRESVAAFARRELADGAAERDRDASFSRDLWERCGAMGLQGLPVPEELGGRGLDPLTTALVLEAFARACPDGGLVFSVCAHLLACVVPVWKHGTPEQRERWLPGLCDGTRIATNGMTEATAGSEPFRMATTARRDADRWVLDGTKLFASNGPVADVALVYAATDPDRGFHGGVTAFLVEADAPGFGVGQRFDQMGLRSCPVGELVLEGVVVSGDAVIGGVGAGGVVFSDAMNWERTCLAATHVGVMERLLADVAAYARERRSGGRALLEHQAVAHRIADMDIRLEAARGLVRRAAAGLDGGWDVTPRAAAAKVFASEALVRTAQDAVQLLGGHGYLTEHGVERALRDAIASTLHSGTSEVLRDVVARWAGRPGGARPGGRPDGDRA